MCLATAHAQVTQRFSAWTQASTEVDLTKDLEFQVTQMFRSDLLPYSFKQLNTELQLGYKFNKHWSAGGEFRFIGSNDAELRYSLYGKYRDGIEDFELQIRSKYQVQTSRNELPESAFRNKFLLGYEVTKDIMPYISYEIFYTMYYRENSFNEYRIEPGLELELNKHNDLALYYIHGRERNTNAPTIRHVFGLSYEYKW